MRVIQGLAAMGVACAACRALAGGVSLVSTIVIPADAKDLSGLEGVIGHDTPHDRLGGLGSGIAWTGKGNEYVLLPDRGPMDGAAAYRCRFHVATIAPASEPGGGPGEWKFELTRTVMLSDENGRPFVGAASAYTSSGPAGGDRDQRLDPEGVRVGADGTVYISEEYGPRVLAFSPEGKLLRRLAVPEKFAPAVRSSSEERELPPFNTKGRVVNHGFEGLAMLPGGNGLVAMPQGPLIQDGAVDDGNEACGRFIRVLHVPLKAGAPGKQVEWVYPMRSGQYGVSEILAVSEKVFLTIERDSRDAKSTRAKRIIKVDFTGATDVSGVESLPPLKLPAGIAAGNVSTLIDLLDRGLDVITPERPLPAKVEGLTFGPDLPDGRRTLLVSSDNDFKPGEPTLIWVFAVEKKDLEELPSLK